MVVRITFNYFSTETCCDHVRIYDGFDYNSNAIVQLSGIDASVSDMSFSSTQQYMYFYFSSDSSIVSRGFSATFESIRKKVLLLCFQYLGMEPSVWILLSQQNVCSVSGSLSVVMVTVHIAMTVKNFRTRNRGLFPRRKMQSQKRIDCTLHLVFTRRCHAPEWQRKSVV